MGDMEREIAKKQLEQSIVELLMKVVKTNIWQSYDDLASIFIEYRGILTIEDLHDIFNEVNKIELNNYQDEVLDDVGRRLGKFCGKGREIEWW